MNDVPQIVEINEIIEETPTIKTFVFDWDMDKFGVPSPGEFVMVWNFHNEKPMSISLIDKENSRMAISVKNVGEFSSQLHDLKVGDKILVTGPSTGAQEMIIEEMRVNDVIGEKATKGDDCTLKLPFRIRISDKLYKIVEV